MNAFFALFAPLERHPWIALVIAAALALVARRGGQASTWIAAVVWLLYGLYEMSIRLHVICSRECDIRLDLLVIYPALAFISLLGLIPFIVAMWRHSRTR